MNIQLHPVRSSLYHKESNTYNFNIQAVEPHFLSLDFHLKIHNTPGTKNWKNPYSIFRSLNQGR